MPPDAPPPAHTPPEGPGLSRRLNAFDATMLVMGGIIGGGIFVGPHVVARHVQAPTLVLGAWAVGGVIALIGAFVYAELAALRPAVGGVYAYIRDAFHPMAAFLYGWTLLLVVQSGGMAAVAATFARYFRELTGIVAPEQAIAVATLALLTFVNWLGVRAGSNVQSAFMVMKIVAILALVTIGWRAVGSASSAGALWASGIGAGDTPRAFAAALVPVLFAYGGWQNASFVAGELNDPRRDLPRGLLIGIVGVIALYLAVNLVCLRALGAEGLAATPAPASAIMRAALGDTGARLMAAGITVSTVGLLSHGMLTSPRVYYAMARDGVFFRGVGSIHPRTHVPAAAIALQGALAAFIAFLPYDRIVNYVVAIDSVFFGLTGAALLVFRTREQRQNTETRAAGSSRLRTPGHPVTTIIFVAAFWLLTLSTVYQFPRDAGVGVLILLAGVPAYLFWKRRGVHPRLRC